MATPPPPPLTLGESLAPRCNRWMMAVLSQILCLDFALAFAYDAYKSEISPSPFSSNLWLLALLISLSAYFSLLCMVRDYAYLFLPRTPVAIVEKIHNIGMWWGVGVLVIGGMVSAVLGLQVQDTRVLAACTGVAAAFIVGLVGFWVCLLARMAATAAMATRWTESSVTSSTLTSDNGADGGEPSKSYRSS